MNAVLSAVPVALAFFVGYGLLLVSRFLRVEAAAEREFAEGFGEMHARVIRKRADRLYRCSKVVLYAGLIFIAGSTVYAAAVFVVAIVGTV